MYDYDFYDSETIEKIKEARSKKLKGLLKKLSAARQKGDEKALDEAYKALAKHKIADQALKEKAKELGHYW